MTSLFLLISSLLLLAMRISKVSMVVLSVICISHGREGLRQPSQVHVVEVALSNLCASGGRVGVTPLPLPPPRRVKVVARRVPCAAPAVVDTVWQSEHDWLELPPHYSTEHAGRI